MNDHTSLFQTLPFWLSQVRLVVKNLLDNAGDVKEVGFIPGLENPLEKGMATYSSILAWRISMDRGAWSAAVQGAAMSQTQLSN